MVVYIVFYYCMDTCFFGLNAPHVVPGKFKNKTKQQQNLFLPMEYSITCCVQVPKDNGPAALMMLKRIVGA